MDGNGRFSRKFMVIEDSPVFATLTSTAIRMGFPEARVEECHSFQDAAARLRGGTVDLLVCGYGLDEGKTAHDIRALSDAPMVVITGRPDQIEPPRGSSVVEKMAGPVALQLAIEGALAAS
jgi:CheY-like chemotaxis protein